MAPVGALALAALDPARWTAIAIRMHFGPANSEDQTMPDGTGNDRIHMTVDEARALGEAAMRGAGFDDEDARILTDHVLDAALCGYEYSGLPKLAECRRLSGFPPAPAPHQRGAGDRCHRAAGWRQHDGHDRGLSCVRGDHPAGTGARACCRLPWQHLDDRTQRLLLRNDRARRPGRDSHGGVSARGGPVRRHAAGARHQPDRLRFSDRQ